MVSNVSPMMFFFAVCILASGYGAWTDIRTGQIPNRLTFSMMLSAPVSHLIVALLLDRGWHSLLAAALSLGGIIVAGSVPYLLFRFDAMGGGDVKLFAGIGAMLGPMMGLEVQMFAIFIALVCAPIVLVKQGKLLSTLGRTVSYSLNPLRRAGNKVTLPREAVTEFRLGPAIFGGTLLAAASHLFG